MSNGLQKFVIIIVSAFIYVTSPLYVVNAEESKINSVNDSAVNSDDNVKLTKEKAKRLDKYTKRLKQEQVEKIIDEYKQYVGTVPEDVINEVKHYRIKVAEINQKKRELYNMLSQGAQNHLKQEQAYKKRLPMNARKLIQSSEDTKGNDESGK